MSGMMTEEELLNMLRNEQEEQLPTLNLEQIMLERLMNPNKLQKVRSRIVEHSENGVLKQNIKATRINEAGFQEELEEEVLYIHMLDDGTSAGDLGIVICQTCTATVKEKNSHRCTCGKICCVLCGKYSEKNDQWYCGFWHKLRGGKVSE